MKKVLLLAAALAVLAACGDSSKPPAQDPSQPPAESAAPATSATAAPSDGANSGGW